MEVGPYRLKDDASLRYNDGSWDEFANLLFVDNPVGTGFSYVDTNSYLHELKEMADQFIVFLEKFFGLFPAYEHDDVRRGERSALRGITTNSSVDLYCWRILCWSTHSLYRPGDTRPQQPGRRS